MSIDPLRHLKVFSPDHFNPEKVHVIGCGATGSKIAMSLAKLGITRIHLWDDDKVEEHNVANQLFGNDQIGQYKVEALAAVIKQQTGIDVVQHLQRVENERFAGIVFLLVDTMEDRRNIFDACLKNNFAVKLVIETRMDADNLRVYSFTPYDQSEIKAWYSTLYSDDETPVSACGASTSVGATADIVSGMAVWQLIRWFARQDKPEHEIIFGLRPTCVAAHNFT